MADPRDRATAGRTSAVCCPRNSTSPAPNPPHIHPTLSRQRLSKVVSLSEAAGLLHWAASTKEPIMRKKTILAVAFALAVAGAGLIAGTMADPEPAEARCSSRC